MRLAIKAHFIVVEDYADFFLASLNVYVLYKKEEALTPSAFFNRLSSNLCILEHNDCAGNKFVLTAVKK